METIRKQLVQICDLIFFATIYLHVEENNNNLAADRLYCLVVCTLRSPFFKSHKSNTSRYLTWPNYDKSRSQIHACNVLLISFTLMLNGCDTTHAWIVYKEKTKWDKNIRYHRALLRRFLGHALSSFSIDYFSLRSLKQNKIKLYKR